jgi:hypothetical protein
MARFERRHYGDYGLPLHSAFGKNFWVGTAAGFLAISSALFCIFLFHGFHLTGVATHGRTLISATLVWTAVFIVVGLSEEFAFRGYLQFTLTTGMGFWPSAFLLSALFGLAHAGNPGESKFGLLSVVFFGLLFCLFLRRTGNLWWAVGFHAGLGADLFLRCSRQRNSTLPQPVQLRICRSHVDYRRQCRSRGQCLHSHRASDRRHPLQPRVRPEPANRERLRNRMTGAPHGRRVPHNVGLFDVRACRERSRRGATPQPH